VVLAEGVIGDHDKILLTAARAEPDAFTLLALQSPVAGDLRAVADSGVIDPQRTTISSAKTQILLVPPSVCQLALPT
jgi:phosphate uptake regulator